MWKKKKWDTTRVTFVINVLVFVVVLIGGPSARSADMASSVLVRASKALVGVVLWGLLVFWVVQWFILGFGTDQWLSRKDDPIPRTESKSLGWNGPHFLMRSFPVIIYALSALLYFELDHQHHNSTVRSSQVDAQVVVPQWNRAWQRVTGLMWAQPLLVKKHEDTAINVVKFYNKHVTISRVL